MSIDLNSSDEIDAAAPPTPSVTIILPVKVTALRV